MVHLLTLTVILFMAVAEVREKKKLPLPKHTWRILMIAAGIAVILEFS